MNLCYWVFRFIFYVFFKAFNRLKVFYSEKIPEEGGVIVASNHASYLDPPLLGVAIKRRATYMARRGLFKIPILGVFIKAYSFPVSRKKPQPSTIKEAIRRLKNNELIVMFPQGSRSLNGDLIDIKRGVELIALLSGSSIVPAFIEGTEKALPVGAWLPRPQKIKVKFGEPIKIQGEGEIGERLISAIKELKGT